MGTGSSRDSGLRPEEVEELCDTSGFNEDEVLLLYDRFRELDRGKKGCLLAHDLNKLPELAMNPLGARLIDVFFSKTGRPRREGLNFREFVTALSPFRPSATKEEKLHALFEIFDTNGDGLITAAGMSKVLRMMVGEELSEDQLRAMSRRTVMTITRDEAAGGGDATVRYEQFRLVFKNVDVGRLMSLPSLLG